MREIKFRAWDKRSTTMYPFCYIDETGWVNASGMINDNKCSTSGRLMYFVLMQFTGLKDKNGKEVFEGDVVKSFNQIDKKEVAFVVEFNSGIFECLNDNELINLRTLCSYDNCEVIGNIYENPELIKSKQGKKKWNHKK